MIRATARYTELRDTLEKEAGLSTRGLGEGRHYRVFHDRRGRPYVIAYTRAAKTELLDRRVAVHRMLHDAREKARRERAGRAREERERKERERRARDRRPRDGRGGRDAEDEDDRRQVRP